MTWQIWLAIASIIFIVFGLVKRLETRMLLIVAGFILCCASGAPMKAFGAFVKGMTNITLVPAICSAMGFAFAVQASKCDQHLVAAVAAPLKKLGGLLIPAATILTFLINIAIMSAAGTAATAGATFIPLLLRAGIRPAAAAAAVGGGTMAGLLLNPGCAHDIYVAKMAEMDLMAFIIWAAPYIVGLVFISAVTLMNPGEISKAFFKGCGTGYAQVIGLIVAAGVFAAGLQATGAVTAFIEFLKGLNEFARWGAAFGPFLMALGTGSGEAAIWAFNQSITPEAAHFGMQSHSLGLLAILAGQFGRTASPLAGAIIIVAGMASADPLAVAKRLIPGMLVALIASAFILV